MNDEPKVLATETEIALGKMYENLYKVMQNINQITLITEKEDE